LSNFQLSTNSYVNIKETPRNNKKKPCNDYNLEVHKSETKGSNFSIEMHMNKTPPPIEFSTIPPSGDHVKKPFHSKVFEQASDENKHKTNLLDDAEAFDVSLQLSSKASSTCKPYHRHLRNDKSNFANVSTLSNRYHREIRCPKLSSRKKCRPRHYVHNIKRPYLDFEKMQKLHSRAITTWRQRKDLSLFCL